MLFDVKWVIKFHYFRAILPEGTKFKVEGLRKTKPLKLRKDFRIREIYELI